MVIILLGLVLAPILMLLNSISLSLVVYYNVRIGLPSRSSNIEFMQSAKRPYLTPISGSSVSLFWVNIKFKTTLPAMGWE